MNIILFLKGLFIGSTMTIPGVSGGTMAIILGVYEDLIHNVTRLKRSLSKAYFFFVTSGLADLLGSLHLQRLYPIFSQILQLVSMSELYLPSSSYVVFRY